MPKEEKQKTNWARIIFWVIVILVVLGAYDDLKEQLQDCEAEASNLREESIVDVNTIIELQGELLKLKLECG